MSKTETEPKPSMIFKAKCKYCKTVVKATGWKAFNEACEKHQEEFHKDEAEDQACAARKAGAK